MNKFMSRAIQAGYRGVQRGHGGPFGACVVHKEKVIAVACNTVLKHQDPTCHAEINAIRAAAKKIGSFDLSGCDIYSTTEPCPMCFSAIHWAKIGKVYYGTDILDVKKRGFNELSLSNQTLKRLGKSPVIIAPVMMKKECLELLRAWDKLGNKELY